MARRRWRTWLVLLAIGCAGAGVAAYLGLRPEAAPIARAVGPDPSGGVAVVLAPDRQTIRPGGYPTLTVTLVNRGPAAVTLVEPDRDSEWSERTPVIEWVGVRRVPSSSGRCGNDGRPFRADEVFTLGPGESRRLTGRMRPPSFAKPGVEYLAVQYTNDPDLPKADRQLEPDDTSPWARVRRSTRMTALSNLVEVVVRAE